MAGISDAAIGKLNSQNKFNGGAELEEDYGVNLYSTFYRRYDPQIGRFSGVDCQSEASIGMSVYQFGGNNPVSMNDPLGDKQTAGLYGGANGYYGWQPNYYSYRDGNGNKWHHGDGLLGTASEGMQWQSGFGSDGFGDEGGGGGGGGIVTHSKYGYSHGQSGYFISYPVPGKAAVGDSVLSEVKFEGKFVAYNNNRGEEGFGWLEPSIHINDGLGGFGSGLEYSSSSFRLTNGPYNGSEFSFKYYSSGWKGGGRAGISTYEVEGFGKGLAKKSLIAGVILGGISVYEGIEKDGGTYGTNAQLATGKAVGGVVGGWAGAETGAAIGATFGSWFGGVGAVPGAIIGGIIGGIWGGISGSEAGEDVVKDMQ